MNEILQRGVGLQPSGITAFSHKPQQSRRRRAGRRSEGDSGENEAECESAGKRKRINRVQHGRWEKKKKREIMVEEKGRDKLGKK